MKTHSALAKHVSVAGLACGLLISMIACGSGGSKVQPPPPPQISVTITPASPVVTACGPNVPFIAKVDPPGTSQTISGWSVAGNNPDNGKVSASGVYTPPCPTVPANPITVTAVPAADTTKPGTVTFSVGASSISVNVTPLTPSVTTCGSTVQFFATVLPAGVSQSVTWKATGNNADNGTVNTSGLYTPPCPTQPANQVNVVATSTVDTTKSGQVSFAVGPQGSITISAIAPSTLRLDDVVLGAVIPTTVSGSGFAPGEVVSITGYADITLVANPTLTPTSIGIDLSIDQKHRTPGFKHWNVHTSTLSLSSNDGILTFFGDGNQTGGVCGATGKIFSHDPATSTTSVFSSTGTLITSAVILGTTWLTVEPQTCQLISGGGVVAFNDATNTFGTVRTFPTGISGAGNSKMACTLQDVTATASGKLSCTPDITQLTPQVFTVNLPGAPTRVQMVNVGTPTAPIVRAVVYNRDTHSITVVSVPDMTILTGTPVPIASFTASSATTHSGGGWSVACADSATGECAILSTQDKQVVRFTTSTQILGATVNLSDPAFAGRIPFELTADPSTGNILVADATPASFVTHVRSISAAGTVADSTVVSPPDVLGTVFALSPDGTHVVLCQSGGACDVVLK